MVDLPPGHGGSIAAPAIRILVAIESSRDLPWETLATLLPFPDAKRWGVGERRHEGNVPARFATWFWSTPLWAINEDIPARASNDLALIARNADEVRKAVEAAGGWTTVIADLRLGNEGVDVPLDPGWVAMLGAQLRVTVTLEDE